MARSFSHDDYVQRDKMARLMSAQGRCCRKSRRFVGDYLGLTGVRLGPGLGCSLAPLPELSRCRRKLGSDEWPDGTQRQGLKVLYDSGEMEFVARA